MGRHNIIPPGFLPSVISVVTGGAGGMPSAECPQYALNLTTYLLQLNTPCTPSQAPECLMAAGHCTQGKFDA